MASAKSGGARGGRGKGGGSSGGGGKQKTSEGALFDQRDKLVERDKDLRAQFFSVEGATREKLRSQISTNLDKIKRVDRQITSARSAATKKAQSPKDKLDKAKDDLEKIRRSEYRRGTAYLGYTKPEKQIKAEARVSDFNRNMTNGKGQHDR